MTTFNFQFHFPKIGNLVIKYVFEFTVYIYNEISDLLWFNIEIWESALNMFFKTHTSQDCLLKKKWTDKTDLRDVQ